MEKIISFTLKVWRQNGPTAQGHFDTFDMKDIPGDTSFLEMLDILNEQLIEEGTPTRTSNWCYNLPTLYASFQRWRCNNS